MVKHVNTIIVGGGQVGLSTSYYLKQHDREHIILEQANQAASAWRNRWDSFSLITPNWTVQLPGAEYQGDAPDGFMVRDEVIAYFENYYGSKISLKDQVRRIYHLKTLHYLSIQHNPHQN